MNMNRLFLHIQVGKL